MELRHIRYFIAVAEQRNFSRAAQELGTAQPSLSQQIRQLEREIGVELFDRAKRQIALTTAGAGFLIEARALLAHLDAAVTHAREAGRGIRGEIRIAYTVSAMISTLPAAIRAYRADHPDVRITLRASVPAEIPDALRRGDVDAGVLLARRDLDESDLEVRRIASSPISMIVPAGHRLAARSTVAIEAIGGETLILFARSLTDIYDGVLTLCRERGFTPTRIEEADRLETILGLIAAGEGVSIGPRVYETFGFRGLAYLELTPAPEPFAMLVARSRAKRSLLTSAFIETCERLAEPHDRNPASPLS